MLYMFTNRFVNGGQTKLTETLSMPLVFWRRMSPPVLPGAAVTLIVP